MLQDKVSNEYSEQDDLDQPDFGDNAEDRIKVEGSYYPTVFFHDLDKQRIVWEIFGAEMFININKNKVCVLTSEIWTDQTKE